MSDRTMPFIFYLLSALVLSVAPAFASPQAELSLTERQQAEFFVFQKKFDEAIRLYAGILEREEGSSQDYRLFIKAHEGAGKLAEAEVFIKNRLAKEPEASALLYAYGYCLYLLDRSAESETYLGKAVLADSGNSLALNALGALLARGKRFAEAVKYVKKAIATNPGELSYYQNLRIIYSEMGEPDRFAEEYRESLGESASSPKSAGYGKTIASELRQKGFKLYSEQRPSDAIEMFTRMLVVYREIKHPPGIVAALFSLGLLYEEMGDSELAEKHYRELLEISPNHVQAREKVLSLP